MTAVNRERRRAMVACSWKLNAVQSIFCSRMDFTQEEQGCWDNASELQTLKPVVTSLGVEYFEEPSISIRDIYGANVHDGEHTRFVNEWMRLVQR